MPILPEAGKDWNLESEKSRFTSQPAVVLLVGEVPERELGVASAESVVKERLEGGEVLLPDEDLGAPEVVDGSIGRGAEGWAPVLQWAAEIGATGIVGAIAYDALKLAARGTKRVFHRLKKTKTRFYVSRGFAALLAVDAVVAKHPGAVLAIEAAEEPSAIAGYPTHELNYVGVEPWIVFLVDFEARKRFIVVIRPTGDVVEVCEFDLEEHEDLYSHVPRPAK